MTELSDLASQGWWRASIADILFIEFLFSIFWSKSLAYADRQESGGME